VSRLHGMELSGTDGMKMIAFDPSRWNLAAWIWWFLVCACSRRPRGMIDVVDFSGKRRTVRAYG